MALVAATTIMLIMMAAAVPAWRYVMKNEREEELIFRGEQIAHAVARYQSKRGNALPVSLEALVKEKFLRRAFKDPMTPDGKWRFVRPGEPIVPGPPRQGTGRKAPPATLIPGQSTTGPGGQATAQQLGPFVGVASLSTEKGLRVVNGRESYSEWLFIAHPPRGPHPFIGRPPRLFSRPGAFPSPPGFPGPGGGPGGSGPLPGGFPPNPLPPR